MDIIRGSIFTFGNNIDTDQIYPGRYLELTEHDEIAAHVMEGADPSFASTMKRGDIIVAGTNFGCGSSREHAVITLKNSGVGAVAARSFARIFFRNAVNLGLVVVEIPDLGDLGLRDGDEGELDVLRGVFTTPAGEKSFAPLPPHVLSIIEAGGIFPLFREKGAGVFG
ncbi:3-isopropylmalate/(R)-2-methylmalate dehydratase small subunit [Aminivibrio pyruvatiphilus]|jgi:3-isopropylmalate dehydratase small subunit|uniref:3-isopropylmalate dehydratase small subunit n=1 Tax=Aminivibrio pyruvatiphilus TaxID=1005740 RepID=A0A4V3HG11_9BACT|nr:3-isopropylmalate dehydratase small subunit [Aminivibrio pyruvatiphilus]TDY59531.1 3-isopropylmalate/(R)-2-methylmalate dehydratase small subunit [Aminivibrio pyruvatiphilus]